jgi:hypothetical protein
VLWPVPLSAQDCICLSQKCLMGVATCSACRLVTDYIDKVTQCVAEKLPARLRVQDGTGTDQKNAIEIAVRSMNALPWGSFPEWIANTTVRTARHAASSSVYLDSMNIAGSAVVLLMLRPTLYSDCNNDSSSQLWRLGFPAPPHLLTLDSGAIRSGRGQGNHRTNIIEGLLGYWRRQGATEAERECADLLEGVWNMLRTGLWLLRQHLDDATDIPYWALLRSLMALKARTELIS